MSTPPEARFPVAPLLSAGGDLKLRRHRGDDLQPIVEQCQDAEMQRWTTVPAPYRRRDAEQYLQHVNRAWQEGSQVAFAIEVDGRFAGTVDLRLEPAAWGSVGYGLAPWARGRQVMTRALWLLLGWGFAELGLAGVQWRACVGNYASRRVAQKCGFQMEGTVRGLIVQRGQRVDGWIGTVLGGELPSCVV